MGIERRQCAVVWDECLFWLLFTTIPFFLQLLKEAVESQRMCELMKQQETHLKQQVSVCLSFSLARKKRHICFLLERERGNVHSSQLASGGRLKDCGFLLLSWMGAVGHYCGFLLLNWVGAVGHC